MKVKTAGLTGPALDWAVETIEIARMRADGERVKQWWVAANQADPRPYSTDWIWGGPIIEQEKIEFKFHDVIVSGIWYRDGIGGDECQYKCTGPTPLVAAMRCFVASKLGDEVEMPEDLK